MPSTESLAAVIGAVKPDRALLLTAALSASKTFSDAADNAAHAATEVAETLSDTERQHGQVESAAKRDVLQAAATSASDAQLGAVRAGMDAANANSFGLKMVVLFIAGLTAYAAGIWLALKVGRGSHHSMRDYDKAVANAADALIATGSAAAGAIVGILAPSPKQQASDH